MKNFKLLYITIILTTTTFAQFKLISFHRPKSALDNLPKDKIADFKNIPQKLSYYAKQIIPFSRQKQLSYNKEFNNKFFAPWKKREFNEPNNYIVWAINMLKKRELYLNKKRVLPKTVANFWIKNFNLEALDTVKSYAITISHANLRAAPTATHIYGNPKKGNKGFPFDILQNSAIYPNTPLYISHYSKDKRWAFVHSPATFGWIKMSKIALVNKEFINRFKNGKYAIAIKDNMALLNGIKRVSIIKIGTIFPIYKNYLLIAIKDKRGFAKIAKIKRPSKKLVAKKPIIFNAKNISYIAKQLKKDPYAWGGIAYSRDCSATTKDFFAPFGIFLHRNSADQAKDGIGTINIKYLKGRAKKDAILAYAKPFRSLLYVPGHIGIYIGKYKNEPIIMHTYWGVRLKDFSKKPLTNTIITTTQPGKELPNLRRKSMMSNTLQKIINF